MYHRKPSPFGPAYRGLTVERNFSTAGVHPFDQVQWELRTATINKDDGSPLFEQRDVEVPVSWSQLATNVVAQKYFRGKIGTPGRETSIKDLIDRVAKTIAKWGEDQGYFATIQDADTFYAELTHLLVEQKMAFNSPVWFNVGAEEPAQCSACFINSVDDTMESILDLAKTEALLFKYGSGTGTNLSTLRSSREWLSGGGQPSGPVSFMKGFDAFAGVIKSGGKTRRAAKMVILNIKHGDVVQFIQCKAKEERKAWALIDAGYDGRFDAPEGAYASVFFQNSNNTVRVTDEFMEAVKEGGTWQTVSVTTGEVLDTFQARDLWNMIVSAAYQCADPGLQFDDTINAWHPCPNSGRQNASNPCQPEFAPILTKGGIRTFGEIEKGSVIWTGNTWAKVKRKVFTGVKPVYRYHTRAGSFIGTEDHRVFSGGERVPAGEAETIDIAVGPWAMLSEQDKFVLAAPRLNHDDALAIMDGLVLGDGGVRRYNEDRQQYTVLYIGKDDQDYFSSEVAGLIDEKPFDKMAWRVNTSLAVNDLPKTYERTVPWHYYRGDIRDKRAFLRGLYSANGSICGNRVTLKASSFQVIDRVQQMLSSMGIRSYYTTNPAHDVEFDNGEYTCRESYDLNITTDRGKFHDLIGFIQKDKMRRLEEAMSKPARNWSKPSYEIVKVEYLGEHEVADIEVDHEDHSYWTGGLLVSNCSEYMFLDDSACNLASLNLRKFQRPDGSLDVECFQDAVDITILAQEIIVDNSGYPTQRIAENSYKFRPLGLGYANLGAFLMARGVPYDSEEGRAIAAGITAVMGGRAYYQSAKIAEAVGVCEGFGPNRHPFLVVIANHLNEAKHLRTLWSASMPELMNTAVMVWDSALVLGNRAGFRNCQTTVLAPTGTIGFLMDCDTTGIEPDIALVKYKRLVGGGMLKIVNQTVEEALLRLGYDRELIDRLWKHIDKTDTIEDSGILRLEHLPVFDCAFRPKNGKRSIHYMGHIRMMAAVQPFLSGAISKTVNMPQDASESQISDAYMRAWEMGLKAIAIYRDGCKRSQPLSTSNGDEKAVVLTASRRRLPDDRPARTHKFSVGGHEGYITVGYYDDARKEPGEVFIRMAKEGSTVSGLMDAIGVEISMALQYGIPLALLVSKHVNTRFEPSGWTGNQTIPRATSLMDYVFRWLAHVHGIDLPDQRGFENHKRPGLENVSEVDVERDHLLEPPRLDDPRPSAQSQRIRLETDAPTCQECGSIMIRNGACHKCMNCGSTSGCS